MSLAVVGAFLILRRLPPELTAVSRLMPYLQDNFSAWGYGVPSLYLQGEALPLFGRLGRALLTLIALAGSVALMVLASAPGKRQPLAAHPAAALAGIQLVLQLLFLLTVSTRLFDRYFVLLVALAVVVVAARVPWTPPPAPPRNGEGSRAAISAGALAGLVFLAYGLATQHDYLALQGAVARARAWLASRGVPPLRRDTGFEFPVVQSWPDLAIASGFLPPRGPPT